MTTLNELRPGDKVALWDRFTGWQQAEIERVTNTQVIVNAARYNRENGYEITSGRRNQIRVLDEAMIQQLTEAEQERELERQRNEALAVIRNTTFRELPLEKLQAVTAIIQS